MSRSGYGYNDDSDNVALYRQAVESAILGKRGQRFMRKLRDSLDAMPVKRLITDEIANENGEVCALGSVDPVTKIDPEDCEAVAAHFDIAPALAAEIVYRNDEDGPFRWQTNTGETPEERWTRMRAWVAKQIGPDEAVVEASPSSNMRTCLLTHQPHTCQELWPFRERAWCAGCEARPLPSSTKESEKPK